MGSNYIDDQVLRLSFRFTRRDYGPEIKSIQKQYIVEETALSLYMTEIFGTATEVYRREEDGLVKFLYDECQVELGLLVGKEHLVRKFIALETLITK